MDSITTTTTYKFKITNSIDEVGQYVKHLNTDLTEFVYTNSYTNEYDKFVIQIGPPVGITSFVYDNIIMNYHVIQSKKTHGLSMVTSKHVEVFLTFECDCRQKALDIFTKFVSDMEEFNKNKKDGFVSLHIYRAKSDWIFMSNLPKRDMSTVYLDNNKKLEIIKDLNDFYLSSDDYKKFGIPYTRKYLFCGPPGVGKTSFIFALASIMDKNIYMINFNSELDDIELMSAISSLDNDSLLVLEDIDSLFDESGSKTSVSFSGLLNTLDGFGRKERMVVFMTTNNLDKLQDALIRPGRVDQIMNFTAPIKEQIKEMFEHYFPSQINHFDCFYKQIINKHPTTSLLQKFFFDNRNCVDILEKMTQLSELIQFYSKKNNNMFC